jgi:hypothetical protein
MTEITEGSYDKAVEAIYQDIVKADGMIDMHGYEIKAFYHLGRSAIQAIVLIATGLFKIGLILIEKEK